MTKTHSRNNNKTKRVNKFAIFAYLYVTAQNVVACAMQTIPIYTLPWYKHSISVKKFFIRPPAQKNK